jgi:hypothetical protein
MQVLVCLKRYPEGGESHAIGFSPVRLEGRPLQHKQDKVIVPFRDESVQVPRQVIDPPVMPTPLHAIRRKLSEELFQQDSAFWVRLQLEREIKWRLVV